jgi:hypothetical protein
MAELSAAAAVSPTTIWDHEAGVTLPSETNLRVMRAVLEREGVEFLEEDGVRMRKGWR